METTDQINGQSSERGINIAIIAYITLIGLVAALVMNSEKKYPFASFHIRQSMGLLLTSLAFSFINIIPLLGQLIFLLGFMLIFIMWVGGLINAINGKEKPIIFLGKYYAEWFKNI